ncbi:hypothetical protein SUDANB58_04987 [Streptomyces sp. enrichment culture]|uniref:hypothetical protein n=1 Tax=Streptomyces sp. enrichment culture TaxID=1795815 RepID=UPI003F57AD7A
MSATQLAALARTTEPQSMLRRFLALDAVVTGANALAYLALPGPLGRLLGVGPGLLTALGAFLLAFAAGVGWLATRTRPAALPVRAVVELNLAWAALSFVALVAWLTPTMAGAVWGVLQAITVSGFALLQYGSLKVRQDTSV